MTTLMRESEAIVAGLGLSGDGVMFVDGALAAGPLKMPERLMVAPLAEGPGVTLALPPGVEVAAPLWLVFVARGGAAVRPRVTLRLAEGSALTVVELHLGEGEFEAETEIELGASARLSHTRLQRLAPAGRLDGRLAARLDRDSRYGLQLVALGGDSRLAVDVALAGEGAEAELDGLACLQGEARAVLRTQVTHAAPRGRSRQLHKVLALGQANSEFVGRIRVERGAVSTDAAQTSRGLLLEPGATIEARPELMIFADEVKCAHGAAVGQLDPEALFYLQARALSAEAARELLTVAFAEEALRRIPVGALREALTHELGRYARKERP